VYDISDAVAVEAEREAVWEALLEADLIAVGRTSPMVGMLGAVGMLTDRWPR
jgi:hypothetical protein